MTRPLASLLVVLLLIGTAACALTQNSTRSGVSPDRIVVDQLPSSVSGMSAYEIVERYQPQWLQKRGASSVNAPTHVQVYLDGNRSPLGPPGSLRQLPAMDIESIEHLSGSEAQARYGLNNTQGAIVVHTKAGR